MKLKTYSLAVAAFLFFINRACFAQSALPDTPAGNQAKGWLEVFNAGDVEKRRAFLQKNYPSRLERFDRETEMRRGTGGFDVMKVVESTPTKIVLLIQERRGDQIAQFTVEVEPEDRPVDDRSIGYMRSDGAGWQPNTDTLPYRGTSAGGGYSTVEDLLKFATALQTNKLLKPQYTEMLTTGRVETPNGGKYAYGFQEATVNGTRCFGHGGGAPGMNGELKICPGPGYVVAVLANLDPPAATRVADFITNRLPTK